MVNENSIHKYTHITETNTHTNTHTDIHRFVNMNWMYCSLDTPQSLIFSPGEH